MQDETPGEEEDQDEAGDDAGEKVGSLARAMVNTAMVACANCTPERGMRHRSRCCVTRYNPGGPTAARSFWGEDNIDRRANNVGFSGWRSRYCAVWGADSSFDAVKKNIFIS